MTPVNASNRPRGARTFDEASTGNPAFDGVGRSAGASADRAGHRWTLFLCVEPESGRDRNSRQYDSCHRPCPGLCLGELTATPERL